MLFKLILLFCTMPLLELYLLFGIGSRVGFLPTVLLVVAAGVAGAALARAQGLRTLQQIAEASRQGRMPADALLDGVGLLIAGVLLITPGLISDLMGMALLVPPVRRAVARRAFGYAQRKLEQGVRDGTITVHAVRVDADDGPWPGPPRQMLPPE